MSPAASIRPAMIADAPTLARLYRDAYATNVDLGFPSRAARADRGALEAWIRESRVFVAVTAGEDSGGRADDRPAAGKLVGAIRYRDEGKYDPDAPEFGRLAVPPRARGQGIGNELIEHVETLARREDHDRMRLRTFADHPFLPEVYRRRGYHDVRVRELEGAPFDVLHMQKEL
ncbi:GNAT family N-acetyltransferase [Natronosalvus halobius]|uniref:GNAT family N-acetyltransferase n=1 Tax=Natronosalvus halobius TaxID=2953746 RepID=UPI0020A05DE5|nr:GNAT family N-acetyltransferase [Natronosalvus halobius]USZ70862.1 GNAT family N-acetyltransferase [Natronosalvus halobius]